MTPKVPVTPEPAVAGPLTGGQYVAQDPVHLDVVEVSGANQYKVNPAELVSTWVPLIVVVFNAVPDAADAAPAAGVPLGVMVVVVFDELAQAVTASRAAARLAVVSSFRMEDLSSHRVFVSCWESRNGRLIRSPGAI
jgi:hypothetical protein